VWCGGVGMQAGRLAYKKLEYPNQKFKMQTPPSIFKSFSFWAAQRQTYILPTTSKYLINKKNKLINISIFAVYIKTKKNDKDN